MNRGGSGLRDALVAMVRLEANFQVGSRDVVRLLRGGPRAWTVFKT